jgi:hypothetical protein
MSSAIPAHVDQFVAMRFLRPSFIAAMVVAAHQLVDAQTLPHVGVRAGSGIPVKGMQAEIQAAGKTSQWDVPPKFISGAAPIYPPSRLRQRAPGLRPDQIYCRSDGPYARFSDGGEDLPLLR